MAKRIGAGPLTRAHYALREGVQIGLAGLFQALGRDHFRAEDFSIVPLQIPVTGLNHAFDGFRIAHISDLHMGHWINGRRLRGIAGLIASQKPDLIAITGDFVSYSVRQIADEMVAGLRAMSAPAGVVAVLGNHDHMFDPQAVRHILSQANVRELANDILTLKRGAAQLHIAGVDDIIEGDPCLEEVLNKLPADGPAILLAHEPDFADEAAATGRFALQLSGHSHGGQIILPPLGPIRGHGFRKYPLGRYKVGDMIQYTNPGIGTHVLRLRINCPPEITILTLTGDGPGRDACSEPTYPNNS